MRRWLGFTAAAGEHWQVLRRPLIPVIADFKPPRHATATRRPRIVSRLWNSAQNSEFQGAVWRFHNVFKWDAEPRVALCFTRGVMWRWNQQPQQTFLSPFKFCLLYLSLSWNSRRGKWCRFTVLLSGSVFPQTFLSNSKGIRADITQNLKNNDTFLRLKIIASSFKSFNK